MKFRLKKLNGECVDAAADNAGEELVNRDRNLSSFFRKYASRGEAGNKELHEIEWDVRSSGYVLLWSDVVEDFIAFYSDRRHLREIPPDFVPYSIEEL